MESKARLFGHPVHQMLVVFPLGLLGGAVVFDLLDLWGAYEQGATVAYALIAAGVVSGLLAAPWGTIDWLAVPKGTRAKAVGAWHGGGNVVVLLLFAASWWLRRRAGIDPVPTEALALSFAGGALSLLTAWLGGELVDRLGIGVSPNAHPDAPSSLSGPAEPRMESRLPASRR